MIRFPFGRSRRDDDGRAEPEAPATETPATRAFEAEAFEAEARAPAVIAPTAAPAEAVATPLPSGPLGASEDFFARPSGAPGLEEQVRMVEAMLFASPQPLSTAELASRMPIGCDAAVAVRRLEEMYAGRGVVLARVAGKWAFRTASDLAWLLAGEAVESRKLSRAAIETLAIIAYHQPVTRAEIEEIRQVGVSKGTIDLLMELEWVKLGRRRQTPGRPVTFVTTEKFLEHFGLETTRDLPRIDELRQAGLLDARPPIGFRAPDDFRRGDDEDDLEIGVEDEDGDDGRQPGLLI